MCAITSAPSARGDMAVPKSGSTDGGGVRHKSFPVSRSSAERIPPMPKVKDAPSRDGGRGLRPGAVRLSSGVDRVRRGVFVAPELLTVAQRDGADDLAIALPRVNH